MSGIQERLDEAIGLKIDGRYDEATKILTDILSSTNECVDAHWQLGLIYGFQGLFDESLDSLTIAVSLDQSRPDILCDLAMTHAMLGMFDEAKLEFEKVLSLDPDNKTAKQQLVYFSDIAAAG